MKECEPAAMRQAVEKLNPADGVIRPGSAQTYACNVVRARWYRENLGFDLDPLIGMIRDGEDVVVDVSAGTGGASEYLLEQLAGQGKRLGRLVLTDVDIGMARGYMQYAMKALEGFASSTCDGIDYYILKNRGDGTFDKVSGIAGLRADLVIMANAIHLVPGNQLVSTLQGIFELLKPDGTAIIGSGSVLSAAKPAESVRVDELFEHVRARALSIIRTGVEYIPVREELGRRSGSPRVTERLAQVFPVPPTLEALLPVFREVGFEVRTRFHCTRLERDDYRPFIVGVAGYVKAAILPEAISDPKLSQDRALMSDEALMALARRAYEEVFDSVPGGHFSMWWTSITATRPPSSSCPGQAGKAGET